MRGEIAILSNRLNKFSLSFVKIIMGKSPSKTGNLNQAEKNSGNFFWIRILKFSKKMYFIACLLCSAFLPSPFFLSFFCWKFYFLLYKSMKLHKDYLFNFTKGKTEMKRMVKKICCPQVYLAFCRRPASAEEEGFVPKVGRFNLSPLDRCSFI